MVRTKAPSSERERETERETERGGGRGREGERETERRSLQQSCYQVTGCSYNRCLYFFNMMIVAICDSGNTKLQIMLEPGAWAAAFVVYKGVNQA